MNVFAFLGRMFFNSYLINYYFTWCFHKQNIICFIAMQTYKELSCLIIT
jgi:hypothetical protein